MNSLKQNFALLMVAVALFMTACTQDSDCTPPVVETNIIGSWTVTGGTSTVEFQANGTLVDPSDDILGGSVNNDTFSVKTYTISNDTLYTVAASATTSNSIDVAFPITNNECDKISLSVLGLPVILTRE